ncbi:MAG: OprO/OprP family phosphate-selective porin [Alistipes sp.]|nr:OprO/OprP family phosphate-selective porin [Alistipes sp.]
MKPLFTFLLLLSACALKAQPTVSAAEPAATADNACLAGLSERVDELETRTSTWQKIAERLPRLSGYVQTGYEYSDNSSSFFLKRVRLSLAGDIAPKLDYKIQFEFCTPRLVDAYVQYRPFGQLNVKVGQYKIPFSIENTDYVPTKLELIDYPMVLQKLMGFSDVCGISATGRDLGATLFGGFFKRDGYSIVSYDLGVFNGQGINTKDANKSKDIAARLMIRPAEGLVISGSYYWGEYGVSYLKRERYGAGVCYDRGSVVVRGEWIGGITGMADSGRNMQSDGWYVMAGWRAPHNLMPVARFENFTLDTDLRSQTRQNNYTVGLLWAPVKYLRCQLNYTYEDYGTASDLAGRNVLSVMFTGMF